MLFLAFAILLVTFFTVPVSSVLIQVPSPLVEGSFLTIVCITRDGTSAGFLALQEENGNAYNDILVIVDATNSTVRRFRYGNVNRDDNGRTFRCIHRTSGQQSDVETLIIVSLAEVAFALVYQPVEGQDFTAVSTLFFPGNPPISSVMLSYQASVITNGSGVTVLLTNSVLSVVFSSVSRTASGRYDISLPNSAGSYNATFMLDVRYPPEFSGVELVRSAQLVRGSSFTFNYTPIAANPAPSFSFMRDGSTYTEPAGNINGPVLTISSVVRADTGNYSCTATNTAGSTTLYHNLLVVAPPTTPRGLTRIALEAFSVTYSWTPPTDDGGISHPSWTPPSPSSSPIIQYTVTYSNSSGSWSVDNLNTTLVTLSYLQHSTDYTVAVAARNAYGQSIHTRVGTFRTLDSKPILQAVVLAALSLNNFTANVTFLTVGGQDVTSFSIRVNGTIVEGFTSEPVAGDGKDVMVSLLIEGRSFTKGTYYTVEITATNSVGTSEPITGLMFVPNTPNVTGIFTEVPAGSIPSNKCCAGVELMLAQRVVVADLSVVLAPAVASVSLDIQNFTLYIGGVQAGTNYTAVITVSNIFGSSSEQQLQLKPLLGVPSNPNPPTVSVNGGQVTVELSTAYPGTVQTRSGSMFGFEIQFIEDGQRSSRQSKNVTHSVTSHAQSQDLSTAVRASYVDSLDPGLYSVRVTAVNEHGRSSAVMSESTFTVTAYTVTIIIAVVTVVVGLVLIALIIVIVCIICCLRVKKRKRERYCVNREDTELAANRNAEEETSLNEDFMDSALYDVIVDRKATKGPPKPPRTPASTAQYQPPPGGDVYATVNKPKKASVTPTPNAGDMYATVDTSKKTKKPKPAPPTDQVIDMEPTADSVATEPTVDQVVDTDATVDQVVDTDATVDQVVATEATLSAEVVQEKKEPAVPPNEKDPEVDKPTEESELQYAVLNFSKAPSSFKRPAPPTPDEITIYTTVAIANCKKQ